MEQELTITFSMEIYHCIQNNLWIMDIWIECLLNISRVRK